MQKGRHQNKMTNTNASRSSARNVGVVPVKLGDSVVVSVPIVTEEGARTHFDFTADGPRIVISDSLDPERANRAVAAVMPALIKALAQKVLN